MLLSAFVGQADLLAFFRFVLGLIKSFLWLSIFQEEEAKSQTHPLYDRSKSNTTRELKKVAKSHKPPSKKQRKGVSDEKPEASNDDDEEEEEEEDGDGDEEEDTEPLADHFLDGSDDEEEPLGSDSDSDGFDLAMAGSGKSKAIDEERKRQEQDAKDELHMNIKEQPDKFLVKMLSNFKDLRPEEVKKKKFVE
ncbi:hypothetical protein Bca101_070606 [Brassica carinata]